MTAITATMVKELRDRTGAAMMACKKALQESSGDMEAAIDILRKAGDAKAAKRAGKTAAEGLVVIASDAAQKNAFMLEVNCETDFVARDTNFSEFAKQVAEQGLAHNAADLEATLALPISKGDSTTIEEARVALVAKIGENVQLRRVALMSASGIVGTYCHSNRIGVLVSLDKANADLAKGVAMHIAASNPQAVSADDVPQALIDREKEIFTAQAKESGKPAEIIEKMVTGRINKFLKEVSLLDQPFVKDPENTVGKLLKAESASVSAFVRFEVGEGIEKEEQDFAAEVMSQARGQ